ncbi:MAG: hypothetical protein ABI647_21960, partial [Gemmatimonadota bacterium]
RVLTEVTHNLTIAGSTSITSLTGLAGLMKVGGNLRLISLPHVTTLAPLSALSYGGLDVEVMDGLTSLSGLRPAPATMTGGIGVVNNRNLLSATIFRNVTSIDGALDIRGNPLFTDLNDLGLVTHVGGNVAIGGTGLTTIARLASLQSIDGDLRLMVNDLDGLSTFELPALTIVGGDLPTDVTRFGSTPTQTSVLTIRFAALTNIIGGVIGEGHNNRTVRPFDLILPALQTVGQTAGAVNIDGTPGLRNLTVAALNTAAVVNVDNDPDLEAVVIGSVSTASTFNIDGNPSLKSIQVNGVFQVDGTLNIDGNASLVSIHFGGPIQIGETMNIDGNRSLLSIQFSGGTVGGTANIDNNALLSSLTGPLSSVGGTLNVDHNPKLSNQAAMAWAAAISAAGGKNIKDNGTP